MPTDRGTIDAQLKEIGEGERWWELREFRELPYVLDAGERIQGLVSGRLQGSRRPRVLPLSPWLLVATTERLLCLKQERFGRKQVELRRGQITGIQHHVGVRSYHVTLHTARHTYRLRIPKADAFRFIGALAPLVPGPAAQLAAPADASRLPGSSALASLPGISRLMSRGLALPAPEYATRAEMERLQATVDQLENDVDRLQHQVEFLEKLLQDRTEGLVSLPGAAAGS